MDSDNDEEDGGSRTAIRQRPNDEDRRLSSGSDCSATDAVYYLPAFDGDTHWYDSIEEMKDAINLHAKDHGYAIKITHTRKDKTPEKNPRRVVFNCDRHRAYQPSVRKPGAKRRKKVSTKKTNCPMGIEGLYDKESGKWFIQPINTVDVDGQQVCVHNHLPSAEASSHPQHRRLDLTAAVKKEILTDAEIGVRPSQTLARLMKLFPGISLRPTDIVNTKNRVLAERMGDKTRTEYLLSLLAESNAVVHRKVDTEDRLTHLLFADQAVLDVFSEHPDLILMDCTYKTNKFGMPLLNIIGVTGMNTTTHLAQAFLRGEKKEDYVWALRALKATLEERSIHLPNVIFVDRDLALIHALKVVFPDVPFLLCLWHVIKAVETHARQSFARVVDAEATREKGRQVFVDSPDHRAFCDKFLELVRASTEEEYELRRKELCSMSSKEATYLDQTWLAEWKTNIVRYWTNDVLHFGLQTTSRVEGYHRSLKRWLDTSAGDLLSLFFRLQAWWAGSLKGYKEAVSDEQVRKRVDLSSKPIFRRVYKKIHNHALDQCVKQLDLLTNSVVAECTRRQLDFRASTNCAN